MAALNQSPWLRAELRRGPVPQMRSLVVEPRFRRDISAIMLTFWIGACTITVTGDEKRELSDTDALTAYLVEFAENSQFPSTVAQFQALQGEDVPGVLRAQGLLDDDPADVPVLVDAAKHNELARRALENQIDTAFALDAATEERPRMGQFNPSVQYRYLESGGFALRVVGVRQLGPHTLRAHGDIVSLDALKRGDERLEEGEA